MVEKEKLYDYDVMKAITILLVVLGHVTRMFTPVGTVDIAMESEFLTVLTEFIYMFHMPAFVAVSGAVYYFVKREKGKYRNQKKFIVNKAKRILIPYIFFAIMVVLPTLLYIGLENNMLKYLIRNLVAFSGPNHLWYSVMIFNVFVLFNFFEEKFYRTHFIKNLAVLIVLYIVALILPRYFQLNGTFTYILYFYLGYSFQRNRKRWVRHAKRNKMLLITLISTLVIFFLKNTIADFIVLSIPLDIFGAVSGSLLLYFVSYRIMDNQIGKNKVIENLAKDSYGIFLFHPMIIYTLSYWIRKELLNPYLAVIAMFFISLILSIILLNLFRKLGIQVLIGEKSSGKFDMALKNAQ